MRLMSGIEAKLKRQTQSLLSTGDRLLPRLLSGQIEIQS
jgi:hypothetical protein